ncbi:hypothetical protein MMC26_000933 [Xylographa opegraphella]|nr:hypothetical protein [Xylographa opegraphella]
MPGRKQLEDFFRYDIKDGEYLKMLDGGNKYQTIVENQDFRIDNQKHALNISPQRLNLQLQTKGNAKTASIAEMGGRYSKTGERNSVDSSQTIATLLIELPAHKSLTPGRLRHFWLVLIAPTNEKNQPSNGKGIVRANGDFVAPFVDNDREQSVSDTSSTSQEQQGKKAVEKGESSKAGSGKMKKPAPKN